MCTLLGSSTNLIVASRYDEVGAGRLSALHCAVRSLAITGGYTTTALPLKPPLGVPAAVPRGRF